MMATARRCFPRKLTGAQARLFAAGCQLYSEEVEAGNDSTEMIAMFCWLSRQQRLLLVREVMIGLLCEEEPLPPETMQHHAAYLAILETIKIQLIVETDDIAFEIGEDLLPTSSGAEMSRPRWMQEEAEERLRSLDLITRQAEKNKKKFDRQAASAGEEFKVPEEAHHRVAAVNESVSKMRNTLFSGPPVTQESRQFHRPLTENEKLSFFWRRLCDDAFQEDPMLRSADFDWKCFDYDKWHEGTAMLMCCNYGFQLTATEEVLLIGEVGEREYADRSCWPRIRELERIVKELRDSYDPYWNPEMAAVDQRYIFAICSTELHYQLNYIEEHCTWAKDFIANCAKEGIEFTAPGNYQKRLEIYRMMEPSYKEGLSTPLYALHHTNKFCSAKDFKRVDPVSSLCHSHGCRNWNWSFDRKNKTLKFCTGCKVVQYCSRECQVKDWPEHKKQCKIMALTRKDKDKMSEICSKK